MNLLGCQFSLLGRVLGQQWYTRLAVLASSVATCTEACDTSLARGMRHIDRTERWRDSIVPVGNTHEDRTGTLCGRLAGFQINVRFGPESETMSIDASRFENGADTGIICCGTALQLRGKPNPWHYNVNRFSKHRSAKVQC